MTPREQQRKGASSPLPPVAQAVIALLLPPVGALFIGALIGGIGGSTGSGRTLAPTLAALGVISWLVGLFWYRYRIPEMGLRGGRPLFAGIGFAALGWIGVIVLRFIFVRIETFGGSFGGFFFLLLFEAFAVQLWTFGVLFQALARWRGPLTAAIGSGVVFGMVGVLLFQESFTAGLNGVVYFLLWGVFYGIVRLRTGSFLGTAVVQSLQSFTTWVVLVPAAAPASGQLRNFYLAAGVAFLIVIWRLWPKREEDYRV